MLYTFWKSISRGILISLISLFQCITQKLDRELIGHMYRNVLYAILAEQPGGNDEIHFAASSLSIPDAVLSKTSDFSQKPGLTLIFLRRLAL
jgi:hypothetical protein